MFSFNNHAGACPKCAGLGYVIKIGENAIVKNDRLSINEGALSVMGFNIDATGITKKALLKRDGDRCAICSLPLQMDGDFRTPLYWSVDHIIPLAKGIVNGKGGHTWDNVQLAHRQCNSAKRDLIGKEWNNGNN